MTTSRRCDGVVNIQHWGRILEGIYGQENDHAISTARSVHNGDRCGSSNGFVRCRSSLRWDLQCLGLDHSEFGDTNNNGSLTIAKKSTGGNPTDYQQGIHAWGPGIVRYDHLYVDTYDPATLGAISSIDFTYDFIVEAVTNPSDGAVATYFLITQGANRWTYSQLVNAINPLNDPPSWETNSASGLDAALFSGIDFSAAGGVITFGYGTANSTDQTAGRTTTWGVDNWRVTINQVPVKGVPEPATLALSASASPASARCGARN